MQPEPGAVPPPRLELRGITKRYPGVVALEDVSISVGPGEVHALLGENGAGKSTLLKILSGVVAPSAGSIVVDGQPVLAHSLGASRRAGIAMIHQELQQVPRLSVAQNMFLGRPMTHARTLLARGEMRRRAVQSLARLDSTIDPDQPIGELRVAKRQIVEIARALLFEARIIAMDEPTSSLMPAEFERLVAVIGQLRTDGVSVIYVSHKLDEVRRLCDRGTVLRDGRRIGVVEVASTAERDIVSMMVGREVTVETQVCRATDEIVLEAHGLNWSDRVRDVSLRLRHGEILGVAGLMGAGRTELLHLLAGLERPDSGEILVHGRQVRAGGVRQAIRAGIGLLPEERKREGIVPLRDALSNASLTSLPSFSRRGWIEGRRLRAQVTKLLLSLQLRPMALDRPIRLFSGGNQQKIIIARWLLAGVEVLLLDEPTRGVDVGAKQEIYRVIRELARNGKAVIVVSSELPEILQISDRVLVMRQGRITAELGRGELSEDVIMQYAARDRTSQEAA